MTDIKPVAWCNEQGSWHLGETPPQDFVSSWKPVYTESAITQAREEGRREGIREAAEVYLHLAEVITRAAEGK